MIHKNMYKVLFVDNTSVISYNFVFGDYSVFK